MHFLIGFACFVGSSLAGYAGSTQNTGNDIGSGSFAGSFSGTGPPPAGFIPQFPIPVFDFGALNSYLQNLQRYHQQFLNTGRGGKLVSYSFTSSSSPSAKVSASSSITNSKSNSKGLRSRGGRMNNRRIQQQAAAGGGSYSGTGGAGYGTGFGTRGGFGGGFSDSDGNSYSFSGPIGAPGFNGAAASASIGPGGVHQTASVFPQNPNSPNINTRFAGGTDGNGGGFKSVFTSSHSATTNVNGQPQTFRQATTTVNDNGKVTTYTAKAP